MSGGFTEKRKLLVVDIDDGSVSYQMLNEAQAMSYSVTEMFIVIDQDRGMEQCSNGEWNTILTVDQQVEEYKNDPVDFSAGDSDLDIS